MTFQNITFFIQFDKINFSSQSDESRRNRRVLSQEFERTGYSKPSIKISTLNI